MKVNLRALALLLLAVVTLLATPGRAEPTQDPAAVLAALDARAAQVTTLRYGALRTTTRGGTVSEERWRFAWEQAPGQAWPRLRIDYDGDTQRVIVCDGAVLVDYVPALGRAMRFELAALSAERAQELLRGILDKVAIPGFRSGYNPAMQHRWEAQPDGRWAIVGRDERGGELRYLLREDHAALLRSEIRTDGAFVLAVDAQEHVELLPGVWFPRRVDMRIPAEAGVGVVRIQVSNLSVQPAPASLFVPRVPASVALTPGQ